MPHSSVNENLGGSHVTGKNKPRQARSSLDTAGRIIRNATRLFAEKGYVGVSIKEISESAKVNIAAINYHYGTKELLFRRIIEQFLSELFVSSRKTLLPPQNREDLTVRLEIFVHQTVEAIIRQPDVITIIHREMNRSNAVFQKTILKHRKALVEFLARAGARKFLAPDVDPFFAAEFLMNQIAQGTRRDRAPRELYGRTPTADRYRDQWVKQTVRLFLGGVMSK
jgi:AcrR family transcriptional regulator